jgi:hypothetical protein
LTDAKEGAVVQLKLLDLMVRNQSEAVPMDAKARADLIDLMARRLSERIDRGASITSPRASPPRQRKESGQLLFRQT